MIRCRWQRATDRSVSADALYIVMEYVRGGTVYDLITMPFQ